MANIVVVLLGNVVDLVGFMIDAALANPLSVIPIIAGLLIWVFAFGLFGYLTLGGLFSGLMPESTGRTPPRQGE